MSWYLFWVYLIRINRSRRKRKRAKKKNKNKNDIELQQRDEVDGKPFNGKPKNAETVGDSDSDDDDDQVIIKRPIVYVLLTIWAYSEALLMLILLIVRRKNYPENFLHGFCANQYCKNTIRNGICLRLATSILMVIGGHTVSRQRRIQKLF